MPQQKLAQGICAYLVKHHHLTQQDATKLQRMFAESAKEQFTEFVLDEGLIQESHLLDALSDYYRVPSFDVVGYLFDYNQLHKFPKDFLLRHGIIPITVDQNIMTMVASRPDDQELLVLIGEHVSYDIRFNVGLKRDIQSMVNEFYDKAPNEVPPEEE